jgi:hypothetical protein
MKPMLARLQPSLSTIVYRLAYAVLTLIAALSLMLVATGRAQAAPVVSGEFDVSSDAQRLAAGPDGNMWATLTGAGRSAATIAPGDTPPILSRLAVTPKRFRVANAPTAVTAGRRGKGNGKRKSAPAGAKIAFTLNFAATVKLTFERKLAGRKRGGRCVKSTRALRWAKRCARYVKRGTLARRIPAGGANSVRFSGRIERRALGAGSYRLTAVATDAGGRRSVARRTTFVVVPPAR